MVIPPEAASSCENHLGMNMLHLKDNLCMLPFCHAKLEGNCAPKRLAAAPHDLRPLQGVEVVQRSLSKQSNS